MSLLLLLLLLPLRRRDEELLLSLSADLSTRRLSARVLWSKKRCCDGSSRCCRLLLDRASSLPFVARDVLLARAEDDERGSLPCGVHTHFFSPSAAAAAAVDDALTPPRSPLAVVVADALLCLSLANDDDRLPGRRKRQRE